MYTCLYQRKSVYSVADKEFIGTVYKIKATADKITIHVKAKEKLVVNYYQELPEEIKLGDKLQISGNLLIPSKNTIPNQFNYKEYLYYNGINYIVVADSISKIENNTKIIYYLKEKVNQRILSISYANEYIKTFILGDTTSLDDSVINSFRQNGISHLFSISGMHISLFAAIILSFLKRISYNNFYNYSVVIAFLSFYAILIGSSPSVILSLIMYILFSLNKLFNLKIKKIDLMCLVLIIILLINPYYLYNISFQYSYIISFSLVLYSYKISKVKNKIMKSLYTSLISFLVSFPICIYNFYQANVFSIILNIFLIPYVSIIIFPLSLICFIIPKLSIILHFFISILESISLFISKYSIGIICFSKPNIYLIIIYYILIIMFLHNYKNIYLFVLLFIHKTFIYFDPTIKVSYLDVGQGDSIFIKYPYNKSNILIDTGGLLNSNYSVISNKTIPYLKSIGIYKINYLILSHGDYDHMGEAINLINSFKVDKVIFNCGTHNNLEKKLINVLDKKKIKYYSCIKELSIDNNKLYFLQTKEYNNENDNSNVIYTEFNNYKFLFMGDAGIDKEKDILKKYNLKDIDFLKVGHHGSATSSSEEFIHSTNPKYSLISVGKNNRYGHPKETILNTLKNSKIYRTDLDGSIIFKIKSNSSKIETYSP